jgi:hypothetical protein
VCHPCAAATTFADIAETITMISMVVQGRTLGICEGVATLGAGPANVVVTELTPSLGGSSPIIFSKKSGFATSTEQCHTNDDGRVTAEFTVNNQDLQGLFLTAVVCNQPAPPVGASCTVNGEHQPGSSCMMAYINSRPQLHG